MVILDVDPGVTLPWSFVHAMASNNARFSEIVFTYFTEVNKLHVLGIIPHFFDYFRYLIHDFIVSLLIPFVNSFKILTIPIGFRSRLLFLQLCYNLYQTDKNELRMIIRNSFRGH